MFLQTWKKYLPVITLLMKRKTGAEQILDMNHTDFERAAGGRKVRYAFPELVLENARVQMKEKITPLARDLVQVLQEDDASRAILRSKRYHFSLNTGFQLTIRMEDYTMEQEAGAETAQTDTSPAEEPTQPGS